jgi:hypothetical protein
MCDHSFRDHPHTNILTTNHTSHISSRYPFQTLLFKTSAMTFDVAFVAPSLRVQVIKIVPNDIEKGYIFIH